MIEFGDALNEMEKSMDICYDRIVDNIASVYTPISNVPDNFIHIYGYGAYPNLYGLLDIQSLEASGISRIQAIPTFSLSGQGVLIGVVDTGIDYTHSAFKYADGTSKIYSIWDQSIPSDNSFPQGFSFGTEYTKEQINEALKNENPKSVVPSVDDNGHGTALAGIAAGNRSDTDNFSGVVPNAEIVVVKLKNAKRYTKEIWRVPENVLCYQKNDLMYGIRYLVEVAQKVKRPISILIGIGTSQGGHDERGALSSYVSSLAGESGISISIAAGNEGNRNHHYLGAVSQESGFNSVELKVGPNESGFSMELWGQTPNTFSIDLLSPTGEYIPRIPARLQESREIHFILEKSIVNIDYQIVEAQSGDQLVLIRFRNPAEGIWRIRVYASGTLSLNFHIWLPIHQFISEETYFINPNPDYTLTSPGNVLIPIVVTAYNYTNQSIYINASRGFTRLEGISPSFAAPGVNLIAPAANNGYETVTGTSVSAAHVAGVAAMILEWGIVRGNLPQISGVEIRNLLIRGAKRDANTTYPNKEWGYGILDVYNTFNSLRGDS